MGVGVWGMFRLLRYCGLASGLGFRVSDPWSWVFGVQGSAFGFRV